MIFFGAKLDMMQADFGFFDPKPGDFNGVKLLLRNYLDDKQWDLSGFVDLILEQTTVGTVVKLDEHDEAGDGNGDGDDDAGPFALISALNLARYEVNVNKKMLCCSYHHYVSICSKIMSFIFSRAINA